VPLVAMVLAWAYADRPTGGRATMLGAWTGIAFLFRHDYAAYIGGAAAAFLLVRHWGEWKTLAVRAITCAVAALAVAAPWLLYVQMQQGLQAYLSSAMRFSAAEGQRTMTRWAPVSYAMAALPVAALLAGARGTRHLPRAHVVFAGLLVLLSDLVLLRDDPGSRLPDVYATTAVVVAIVVGTVMRTREFRRSIRPVATSATIAAAAILLASAVGILPDRFNVLRRWRLVVTRLHEARTEIMPYPERAPLVRYISRCTSSNQRVLVGGFAPELPVLSRRAFAGGLPDWIRGYYQDPADIARARQQLAREQVAVAVMIDGGDAFTASWPAIAEELRSRGLEPHVLQLSNQRIEVWVEKSNQQDAATGLPCGATIPPAQRSP